ncbi:unnamed protein product [Polarella glacialis]|uniref:Uncharacterized protein n=1 Tax=Polarella glacialis TaxID=89957 RepID=A0A813I5M4_POLGL|nr:unnamed protein product [Polarella glacialis]
MSLLSVLFLLVLLFLACFTLVSVVANDCQKRNLIGTDRKLIICTETSHLDLCPAQRDQHDAELPNNNNSNKHSNNNNINNNINNNNNMLNSPDLFRTAGAES